METKVELRNKYRAKRRRFSVEERETLSLAIVHQVTDYLTKRQELHHIHIFLPIAKLNEIDTIPLIERLLEKGLDLYTSATDFRTQKMATVKLKAPLDTHMDEFGIPVPVLREPAVVDHIQMVLIPLLAYDLEGNRLGYGMGFYDRFLQSLPQQVVKAGVSFFPPEKMIPSENHDIKLDICFTASKVYQF
jgi:5-formyltetrahydrofolate cyclo-ligase